MPDSVNSKLIYLVTQITTYFVYILKMFRYFSRHTNSLYFTCNAIL